MKSKDNFKAEYVDKYFSAAIFMSSDPLSVVLKAHMLVENLIERLIASRLKKENILDERDFTFHLKIKLIESMNLLTEDLLVSIRRLNKIRNDLAHEIKTDFEQLDISDVLKCFEQYIPKYEPHYSQADKMQKFGFAMYHLLATLSGIVDLAARVHKS